MSSLFSIIRQNASGVANLSDPEIFSYYKEKYASLNVKKNGGSAPDWKDFDAFCTAIDEIVDAEIRDVDDPEYIKIDEMDIQIAKFGMFFSCIRERDTILYTEFLFPERFETLQEINDCCNICLELKHCREDSDDVFRISEKLTASALTLKNYRTCDLRKFAMLLDPESNVNLRYIRLDNILSRMESNVRAARRSSFFAYTRNTIEPVLKKVEDVVAALSVIH